ncbi:hypothetical protein HK101_000241, partial [Irineochytrium annulatum]
AFSQSESVSRCRNVLESKLKALYGLAKLADEEVIIKQSNLEESYSDLRTQFKNERSAEIRQEAEANDMETSALRKRQLTNLVDKLTALKLQLRFQEEEIEKELGLKSSTRQKRAAFQIRLARMDERHDAERNELMMAQNRLQSTVAHIREIELNTVKDPQVVRRKKKENEILSQQSKMQQQKGLIDHRIQMLYLLRSIAAEFEFLREMQIIKIKHLNQVNDVEITFTEDMESLASANRQEEFELIAKQTVAEQQAFDDLEKQKRQLEITHLLDKQKVSTNQILRNHRKHEKLMAKQQRSAVRARENALLLENPVILGDMQMDDARQGSVTDDGSRQDGTSEGESASQGAVSDLEEDQKSSVADGNHDNDHDRELDEVKINSEMNKSAGSAEHDSEEEKSLALMMQIGRDRIRNLVHHHKKILADLRALHRNLHTQKQREQRRKMSEVRKEQEEEIEAIKIEQSQAMNELIATQQQSDDVRKDSDNSQRLLEMMLPAHVMEEIEAGRTPEPKSYDRVTLFFTDLVGFKELASQVSPISILEFLNRIYVRFDDIIARYDGLYKVESVADTYMVAAGLGENLSDEAFKAATIAAATCVTELVEAFRNMDLEEFGLGDNRLQIRAGLHSGAILGGIVGTKMGRYCLFGDTVSNVTAEILRSSPTFAIEERGEVEVKGKGRMITYWLSVA